MDPRKAPGIDELSNVFYKNNWEVLGRDVLWLCNDMLNGDRGVVEINEVIIILIPKIKEPKDISHYRPISLCRVLYKIMGFDKGWVSKIMDYV